MSDSWKSAKNAEIYLPALNAAELRYGVPPDLLARIAYQESHFRDDIVNGTTKSSAGCVGLMQLNPRYYPTAGKSWSADIIWAVEQLAGDYHRFQDWQLAVAAYNDGGGNIHSFVNGERAMPTETENYVAEIMADVPLAGSLIDIPPTQELNA